MFGGAAVWLLPCAAKTRRVLYLCPEMALIGFANRITRIGLVPYVEETFFYATMSLRDGVIKLPDLSVEEVKARWSSWTRPSASLKVTKTAPQHMKELAKQSFDLIRAGAEDIIVLAHSNKEMVKTAN